MVNVPVPALVRASCPEPSWITPEKVLDRLVFPTAQRGQPGNAGSDCPAAGQAGQRGAVAVKVQRAVDGHGAALLPSGNTLLPPSRNVYRN